MSWGVASLGTQLIAGIYGALLPIFYQDYLRLQARWIGLASVIAVRPYAIWNAVNDPLFGYITDSTRSRLVRRILYMRFTRSDRAPFLALTFVLVWFATAGAGQRALFWWMLGAMRLSDTCYTIIGLVYSALLPQVSESDAERMRSHRGLQIPSSLFGLLGMLLGFLIPRSDRDSFRPKGGAEPSFVPLQVSMVVVARPDRVISAGLIMFTTFCVKERPEFEIVDKPLKLWPAVRYTFTSRSFLVLVAPNFMSILTQSLLLGMLFYLAHYLLQVTVMRPLTCLFLALIAGVPVTSRSDRLTRRRRGQTAGVVGAQQLLLTLAGVSLVLIAVVPAV